VATIKQAIDEVQGVLKSITDRHKQAAAQLPEAKDRAAQENKDDPYS
jgi:hypothetical protein